MPRRQAVPHVRFIFAGYSGEYAVGCGYVLVSLRAYASACALSPFGDTVALSPYRLSAIRAFGCGYVLVSLRAYASAF